MAHDLPADTRRDNLLRSHLQLDAHTPKARVAAQPPPGRQKVI